MLRFKGERYRIKVPVTRGSQVVPCSFNSERDNGRLESPQAVDLPPRSEDLIQAEAVPVKVNMKYLLGFMLTIHIGSFHYGKSMTDVRI
jgi:hypothetical protein